MKKKLLILISLIVLFSVVKTNAQLLAVPQTCSANCTVNGTATVVYVTGNGPYTVTLSGATNREITIVNHTSSDLTISPAILVRKTGGSNTSSAILPANGSEFLSGLSGNAVRIWYNGTNWIKL